MKNFLKGLIIVGAVPFFSIAYSKIAKPVFTQNNSRSQELVISAASSMKDALEKVASLYRLENPDVKLVYNFASSGSLQRQIEQGAPVDVFISAAARHMNSLEQKELLIKETRQDLLENQLVLIVASDNNEITNFNDLAKLGDREGYGSRNRFAIGEPNSVPAGQYARETLTHLDIWQRVRSQTVYGKDVRQVLNYVATGNVDAGIVYRSDVESAEVKMVAAAPEQTHSSIVYPVAVVKDSTHQEAAKDFIEFLQTPKAQAIFRQYNFTNVR